MELALSCAAGSRTMTATPWKLLWRANTPPKIRLEEYHFVKSSKCPLTHWKALPSGSDDRKLMWMELLASKRDRVVLEWLFVMNMVSSQRRLLDIFPMPYRLFMLKRKSVG